MKQEKIIALSEFLATASVIAAGFAVGGPIGASVITAIGIELSGNVIDNHYKGLKEAWLNDTDGILNHDLQLALTRAYVKSLQRIESSYFDLNHTLPIKKKKSIQNLFLYLTERAEENFVSSIEKVASSDNLKDYLYLEPEEAQKCLWETIDAAKVIYSNGKDFGDFFKEHLLAELQYWFAEELKTDSKECNRAWRAFQRMLLEGIQTDVKRSAREQQKVRQDLIKLDSLRQRLEEIRSLVDHRLPNEPFQSGLETLISVHSTVHDVSLTTTRTEQKIDLIAADVKELSVRFLPKTKSVRGQRGAWVWVNYSKDITDTLAEQLAESEDKSVDKKSINEAKTKWEQFDWELAARRYNEELIANYGTTRILGKPDPIPLEGIFTDVFILDRPTAFRRFDLSKLKQDPSEFRDEGARAPGLALVKSKDAFRLFILGKPGAGKSTFLKHITLQAAQGRLDRIPIFVSLKKWSDSGLELMPFLQKEFAICGFPDAGLFISTILKQGKAIVLFDGLDEVSQEDRQRDRTVAVIRDFSYEHRRCQCLITCRIAATDYTFEQFKYVELADFTRAQIDSYVDKWFQDSSEKRQQFHKEFAKEENRGLRDLAKVPLLLGLLCLSFDATMTFPQRRVEIYAEALEALLKRWDASKSIKRDEIYKGLTLGRKTQMFARIAYKTFQSEDYFLPQQTLVKEIVSYLKQLPGAPAEIDIDGDAVLKAIEAQHSIFSERALRIYSFSHLTFQEYFTAKHIVEDSSGRALRSLLITDNILESRWREVILLTVSTLDDATFFFTLFKEALEDLIRSETAICSLLDLANLKSQSETANYGQSALRAYHCFRILTFDLARALNRELYLSNEYDVNHAVAQAPTGDLATINTGVEFLIAKLGQAKDKEGLIAKDLSRASSHDRDVAELEIRLDRARLHYKELERFREQALARDRVRELSVSLTNGFTEGGISDLSPDLQLDVHLSNLLLIADLLTDRCSQLTLSRFTKYLNFVVSQAERSGPTRFSKELASIQPSATDWDGNAQKKVSQQLRQMIGNFRGIGTECTLSKEQCEKLTKYFVSTQLLLECLKLAVLPNRHALENSLLISPR